MQRTYKSKKDTGGGLDPREVLYSLDDKSSAFDAFYIRNIKQTKRELSCIGTTSQNKVAANRVRKRKYVRRIVKEVEPVLQESLVKSTYLTPDKSIHVNKGLDLFDQLLKASPEPLHPQINKDCLFDQLRQNKEKPTYGRKRAVKAKNKRLNYSSSDTDHDKENTTDLRKHELIVERASNSPIIPDDSINQMVENISAINNIIKRKSQKESFESTSGRNKNRLTDNLALEERNSPLCSTPFFDKYRGKSIYRFSPIAMGNLDDSSKGTEMENDSIVHVDNREPQREKEPENYIGVDIYENIDDKPSDSPILTSKGCLFSNSGRNLKLKGNHSRNSPKETDLFVEGIEKVGKCDLSNDEKKSISNAEDSLLYKSSVDSTPFLGFTKTSCNDSIQQNDAESFVSSPIRISAIVIKNDYSLDQKTPNNNKNMSRKQLSDHMVRKDQKSSQKSDETMEASAELEPFLGFTDSAIKKKTEVKIINESQSSFDDSEADITMVDVPPEKNADKSDIKDNISSQSEKCSYESDYESQTSSHHKETGSENITTNETGSDDNSAIETENETESEGNTSNKNHSEENDEIEMEYEGDFEENTTNVTHSKNNSENTAQSDEDFDSLDSDNDEEENEDSDFEKQSLYNTCDSIESEEDTSSSQPQDTKNKQPIVVLDRISDSTFKRYYNKSGSNKSSNDSSLNYSSNHSLQLEEPISDDDQNNANEEIDEDETINKDTSSIPIDTDCKEKHISFVTTRRGHGTANESLIMILDDSSESLSSSEGNKTVLSNHGEENKPSDNNKLLNNDAKKAKTSLPKDANSLLVRRYPKMSNVRESTSHVDSKLDISEMKPSIVLQPGKKWERSLSIYRRMTMQSDFEQSILEDEEITKKGRKYRQSVIHTMEMQETQGPLHNESFCSYRSSVVPKPHRTTIRLAKEPNVSRISLSTTSVFDDLTGFLHEDCDDTVIELSKLSIGDPHEKTVVENQDSSTRGSTARDYVLRRCNQTAPILFDECYPDTLLKNCHKIGEGVYGEVFLWRARDGRARVLKVVPIAGATRVNGEAQKDYHEIISEIVIAMELSALRAPIADIERHFDEGNDADTLDLHTIDNATDGFNEVIAVRCVYGNYPSRLLDLWELYDESKGSENDNPASLPADQQYVVLELANAGQDLEGYQFNNAEQAYALFLQVAFTLAVGEEAFQFEHRDLHWGNVLIAPTEQKYATYILRGRTHRLPRRGVAATIIDYSLSRLSLPLAAGERASLYNDLAADDGLFDAVGDYQFEVYRLMRDKLGNDWKNFEPYTNILWLHYTVDKMITALRYKRTNTKLHKHFIAKLKGIKNRILDYRSAVQFVLTDNEF